MGGPIKNDLCKDNITICKGSDRACAPANSNNPKLPKFKCVCTSTYLPPDSNGSCVRSKSKLKKNF